MGGIAKLIVVLLSLSQLSFASGPGFDCYMYGDVVFRLRGDRDFIAAITKDLEFSFSKEEITEYQIKQIKNHHLFHLTVTDKDGYDLVHIETDNQIGEGSVRLPGLFMKDVYTYCSF